MNVAVNLFSRQDTVIGLKKKLSLRLKNFAQPFRIIDLSRNSLRILIDTRISDYFIMNTSFDNVEIHADDILHGKANLAVSSIHEDLVEDKPVGIVALEPRDIDSSYTLWETLYYYNSFQFGKACDFDMDSLPKVPGRGLYTETARQERLAFIRENTRANLGLVGETTLEPRNLTGNIEGFLGSVEVPVGVAGPLWINGDKAKGFFYAPMATTEGALVASATRGATAITKSGGTTVRVLGQRMTRAPVFVLADINSAMFFASWVRDQHLLIREVTKKYSDHAELTEINPLVMGKTVHVEFAYDTGDAAGQNMTTTCTWHACLWMVEQMRKYKDIAFQNFYIEGNLSNDKKVSYQSFIKGRGIRSVAEVMIPSDVLHSVLKVTPSQICSTYSNVLSGSIEAGMIGMNVNVANVIAAIFTATGQDIACVHESSLGHFHMEATETGLYASMMLPSLVIGTVGGGTNLPQQRECLEMLGCAGPDNAFKLAEIIISYCLALDLSTLAAVASGQFAGAHEKLGRNRPVKFFVKNDLTPDFFSAAISETLQDDRLIVDKVEPIQFDNTGSSIITELTGLKSKKLLGLLPYTMQLTSGAQTDSDIDVMVKVKPTDLEVTQLINNIGILCDARLGAELKKAGGRTGFVDCHIRELAVCAQKDPRLVKHMPRVYGVYRNDNREAYVIIQELLKDMVLMNTADNVSGWTEAHILRAIDGIAEIHSIWYGKEEALKQEEWIGHYPTTERMVRFERLWELLAAHAYNEFPKWFTEDDWQYLKGRIASIPEWYPAIDRMTKTLIHNDFNPRNIAFRKTPEGLRLCAYDWELATIHLPQHDLAELLAFVLNSGTSRHEITKYVEYHRIALSMFAGVPIDKDEWWEGFRCSCWDLLVNRFLMYAMAHTARHYGFIERVHATFKRILQIIN